MPRYCCRHRLVLIVEDVKFADVYILKDLVSQASGKKSKHQC